MKRLILWTAVLAVVAFCLTANAWAAVQVGTFFIRFNPTSPDPTFDGGQNDGWEAPDGRRWQFYPDGDDGPFWNTWWYDDPPTRERWKEIFYDLTIEPWPLDPNDPPADGTSDHVRIALNWSNMEYPETGPDGNPPGPDQEWAIEREVIFDGDVFTGEPIQLDNLLDGPFLIPEYNPEWVSMDVWVDYGISTSPANNVIEVFGMLQHECVPEPAGLVLLCLGGLGLAAVRRNRR